MKKHLLQTWTILLALGALVFSAQAQGHYKSFTVSTYVIHGTVQSLMDGKLDPAETWSNLTRHLKIDKVYVEVMRNHTLVDEAGLGEAQEVFCGSRCAGLRRPGFQRQRGERLSGL